MKRFRVQNLAHCTAILALVGCSSPTSANTNETATYECSRGKAFAVTRNAKIATVEFGDEEYRLTRRSSSIGLKYSSADASLIIDGELAVFVTDRVLDLRVCRERHA